MRVILFLVLMIQSLYAEPVPQQVKHRPKYNFAVCAVFKNESKYLKEWIEYHQLVGVDHFYLYNNESRDKYESVLAPYVKSGIVTLIHWPDRAGGCNEENPFIWVLSTQVSAYENALKVEAFNEAKWLTFLDVNEFLVPAVGTMTDLLKKYDRYPGIEIESNHFNAAHGIMEVPKKQFVVETIDLTGAPKLKPERGVAKTIFKPKFCSGFTWPPYRCIFKKKKKEIRLKRSDVRVNKYLNRFNGFLYFEKNKDKLRVDNRLLTDEEMKRFLEMGYEIEDQEKLIYRFLPDLSKHVSEVK